MSANSKNLFESMTRRRVSCPQITQQLWDAIKNIKGQRQVPTAERIQKFMLKEFSVNEEEVIRQLNHCVRDGLIEITKRTISKGNYIGSEQEGYKLPLLSLKPDDFDWYCFDCHRAGDVICCSKPHCLKVYHLACISSNELPEGAFVCHVCRMCEVTPDKFQMKKSKLNRLLGYTLQRLKSKYPLCLKDQRIPPPNKNILVSDRLAQVLTPPTIPSPDENEAWRTQLLIARDMNLTLMEDKIDRHRYKLLEEFHVDALNIVHNMVIYNGVDSAVADIARQMLRDCVADLHEIRQCVDCYKQSHGDKKKLWFCKPCRKPHELVYAKQFGFPYWPAKVIKVEDEQYDVRFFGDQHLRAMIPKAHIRPISVNIHTLQVKRSSAWNKACEELKKHQELLEKARIATNNFTKFIDSSSSSEYESIDSEQERKIEKENRLKRQKAIMEKHNGVLLKQKIKRRRSSSVVSTPKTTDAAMKKKRGRPIKPAIEAASLKSKKGRKKKEVYEFSSDSLDSFNFNNNLKNESLPKKNTDEIFDELLKSGAEKPKGKLENLNDDLPSDELNDLKTKKWLEIGTDDTEKMGKYSKGSKSSSAKRSKKVSESSESSEGEYIKTSGKKIKNKSDTFDSSTISSVDTFESKRRSVNSTKSSTMFSLKEQNQNLSFEKIARGNQEGLKEQSGDKKKPTKKVVQSIYTSSSEADDESDLSSKEGSGEFLDKSKSRSQCSCLSNQDSDSDFVLNSSDKKKSKSKKIPSKKTAKPLRNSTAKDKKSRPVPKKPDLDSDESSESDSESLKETSKKVKNLINAAKKPKGKTDEKNQKNSSATKEKKEEDDDDDYSDESDDEKAEESLKENSKKTNPVVVKPETRVKLPLVRVVKGKNHMKVKESGMSSDSETRPKGKDTSESTDVESPVAKKQYTRSSTKKETSENDSKVKGKETEKPAQRMSQRQIDKCKDVFENEIEKSGKEKTNKKISPKKGEKESNSSDSEEPLSRRVETKKEEMAEMREIFKKYISKLDMKEDEMKNENFSKKNYESSDSEESANKSNKLKQETESESELDKKNLKKSTKKSKTESLEEKVQKIKKQKNIIDDKKVKNKKSEDKEEMKEKEETIVSSSSQEPITRSVAVQTSKVEVQAEESQELTQKTERIAELEKELQVQLSANKLLEVELNKTRVILDRIRSDHEDEVAELNGKHAMNVSEIKKKQWCYNCESEAIYHCCWNTAYCSVECQQAHWQSEHKRVCRRKR